MKNNKPYSLLTLSIAFMLSGCATAGSGVSSVSIQATVEQTHRTVQTMEQELTNVSHSTADIAVRMDASEQQMRTLITLSEDNRQSIAQLQASMDDLMRVLYQREGLTPPSNNIVVTPPLLGQPLTGNTTTTSTPGGIGTQPLSGETVGTPAPNNTILTTPPIPVGEDPTINIDQHYKVAQEYYRKDEYSLALQQFTEHITLYPQSPHLANATYWRAHCYFKMEDYPQAVKEYEQLRTQFPSSTKISFALYNEAAAYIQLGQTEKAKALLQQLIREYPDDANAEPARKGLRQLQGLSQ